MSRFEPEWYDALKGEPLNARMFTPDLAAGIRAKALRPESARRRSRTWRIGGFGAAGLAAMIVLAVAVVQEAGGWRTMEAKVEPAPSARSSGLDSPPSPAKVWEITEPSFKQELYTVNLKDRIFVFRTETWEYQDIDSIGMIVDFYEPGLNGSSAKLKGSVSSSILLDGSEAGKRATTMNAGSEGVLLYFGMLLDSDIADVRAVERDGEDERFATIVQGEDGHRYWCLAIADKRSYNAHRYRFEGLNEKGDVIAQDWDFVTR
ncbi:hypothetical protein ACF3MZ_26380 [Paenibacillaceae bacterium WGS1546]|uniref:hypothetical protein n=1 Tax=Cohnella sp. WGS1546 TaxID=3366810 RepID=UPI00372D35B4